MSRLNALKLVTRSVKRIPQSLSSFRRESFVRRFLDVKRDFRKIKMEDADLLGQNKLFINKILCPYYNVIWAKSKKLHSSRKIHSFLIRVTKLRSGSV